MKLIKITLMFLALTAKPLFSQIPSKYFEIAEDLMDKGMLEISEIEADAIFREAVFYYQKVATENPKDHKIWLKISDALSMRLSVIRNKEVYNTVLKSCLESYQNASQLGPDDYRVWFGWADILALQAKSTSGSDTPKYYKQSFEKYKKASMLAPDNGYIYNSWAVATSNYAQQLVGPASEFLFGESFRLSGKATSLDPENYRAWYNWGTALLYYAFIKTDNESYKIYLQAKEKFERVLEIYPNYALAEETIQEIREYLNYRN